MATVYLGRALGAGGFQRLMAIKVMHPHIAEDPDFVAMFLDEARLAAGIHHPNVVGTFDVEQGSDGLFLVMEYIDGPSLQQLLRELRKRSMPLPLPVALRIFLDILAGLHAAHELTDSEGAPLQLVHRDISPQNVLVGRDGIARITDFGVARAEARISSTKGGQLKGKLPYMSPEQVREGPVDRRCDVYAAGCVLWEMLVGQRLFRADNDGALLHVVMAGAKRAPRDVNPAVPPAIDAACMRALEDLESRYPSAAAFAEAVEEAAAEAGVAIAAPRTVGALVTQASPPMESIRPAAPSMARVSERPAMSPLSTPLPSSALYSPPLPSFPGYAIPSQGAPVSQSPTTHTSVVSSPSLGVAARRGLGIGAVALALTASIVGGLIVWFATRSSAAPDSAQAAVGAPLRQSEYAPAPSGTAAATAQPAEVARGAAAAPAAPSAEALPGSAASTPTAAPSAGALARDPPASTATAKARSEPSKSSPAGARTDTRPPTSAFRPDRP
jgi:serine/threonine-protein kinase